MIKLGILDFDTSHVVEFTKRINHLDTPEDQWVDGAKIVVACPGESKIMPERIPGYVETMKKLGVPLVDKPADMIGKVEGMLCEIGPGVPRSAHFACVLALAWPDGETAVYEGKAEGTLTWPPRGTMGFGYDPVFVPLGGTLTFAELDPAEKHRISHRADAFAKLVAGQFGSA